MSSCASILFFTFLLFAGTLQELEASKAPQDDPDYQAFANQLQSDKELAEYKLNLTWGIFVNNTQYFNLPEFDLINSTLTKCFNDVVAAHPDADPSCVGFVSQDVQQTISDSKYELDACTNLTHSWELIGQLLKGAEEAITNLDGVVNDILGLAAKCVNKFRNPSLKKKCFNTARASQGSQWESATSLTQEAYYQISGGNLLLGAEVSSCQNAEKISFIEKCEEITSEVVLNCIGSTTTTSTTPATKSLVK